MDKNSSCAYKTKRKMADALKTLMSTTAFEKITVSDITEECGIHRQTFYYHFQDRYELLDWLVYQELIEPFIGGLTLDNSNERFLQLFATLHNDKKFYQHALNINARELTDYISRVANHQFADVIKSVERSSSIAVIVEADTIMFSEFFGYGLSGVVLNWVQRGMKETPEEMAARVKRIAEICKEISVERSQ